MVLVPVNIDENFKNIQENKSGNVLINLIAKQKFKIIGLILFTMLIQFFSLWIPVITQRAVDNYMILSHDLTITEIMILIAIAFGTYYLLQVGRTLIVAKFQNYFEKHLMTQFMKKIMALPLNFL